MNIPVDVTREFDINRVEKRCLHVNERRATASCMLINKSKPASIPIVTIPGRTYVGYVD